MLVPLQQDGVTPGGPRVLRSEPGEAVFPPLWLGGVGACRPGCPRTSEPVFLQATVGLRRRLCVGQTLASRDSRVLRPGTLPGCGRGGRAVPGRGRESPQPTEQLGCGVGPRRAQTERRVLRARRASLGTLFIAVLHQRGGALSFWKGLPLTRLCAQGPGATTWGAPAAVVALPQ